MYHKGSLVCDWGIFGSLAVSSGLMEDSNALMGHIGDLLLVNLRGSSGSIRDTDSSLGRLVGR